MFVPVKTSEAEPAFAKPCVPPIGTFMNTADVAPPSAVIRGVPEDVWRVSELVPGVPALTVQNVLVAVPVSPNLMFPMVRLPSNVIVEFAVTSSVLKSAVLPTPEAAVPPVQFAPVAQLPDALPAFNVVHVNVV